MKRWSIALAIVISMLTMSCGLLNDDNAPRTEPVSSTKPYDGPGRD